MAMPTQFEQIKAAIIKYGNAQFACGGFRGDGEDSEPYDVLHESAVAALKELYQLLSSAGIGDGGSVEVEFQNVTLMVGARDPKDAYNKLCELLGTAKDWLEYTTDRYEVYDSTWSGRHSGPTSELFPDETDPPDDN